MNNAQLPFCTNNRHYDYEFNVFHLPFREKNNKNRWEIWSAHYLCSLHRGVMFEHVAAKTPVTTAKKTLKFVAAWFTAIISLGILPYLAKKNYLSPYPTWEPLKEASRDGSKLYIARGDLLEFRENEYIVTDARGMADFGYEKLDLHDSASKKLWDNYSEDRIKANISQYYDSGCRTKKARW